MNSISFRQVKMASAFFLMVGCGIADENWEEKLMTLETSVTQLIHNASVEKKYPALQTAQKHMKIIASDWNWEPGWQMYVKANPDRLIKIYLLLAETAHSLRDYDYDINTPPPPIKVSPPAGPRRFAGMNPGDIDDPVDREAYKKAVNENTARYQKFEREHNLEEWISKYVSLCRGMLRAQSKMESAQTRLVKTVHTTVREEKLKKLLLEGVIGVSPCL